MKIRLLLFFTFLTFTILPSFAQMEDGSVVPNFTATDINGNEYELYDILDQGYTVVIDVFATWCGPCWGFHETHTLEDVWQAYGPKGTVDPGKVFVFGVEGDSGTPTSELENSALGNWLEGVSYPMVDDGTIADLLEISYFPTIYHICQNRIITEAGQNTNPAAFNDMGGNCQLAAGANNAGLIAYEGYEGAICGELAYVPTLVLQNLGTETMTTATIEMSINGMVEQSMAWEGTLNSYQTEEVTFDEVILTGDNAISFMVLNVNGTTDEDASNNEVDVAVNNAIATDNYKVTVEVQTDAYANETYWAFVNSEGVIVAEGGNPNVGINGGGNSYPPVAHPDMYGNNELYTIDVELPHPADCYEFVVTDGYGDGICCQYGNGYFKVTDESGNTLADGGDFEAMASSPFEKLQSVSNEEIIIANELFVFPNPVQNELNLNFSLEENTDLVISVYNAVGQEVKTLGQTAYTTGINTITLPTYDLSSGMYILNIQSNEGNITRKFTVSK